MAISKPADLTRRRFLEGVGAAAALPLAAKNESGTPAAAVATSEGKGPTGLRAQGVEYTFVISSTQPVLIVIPAGDEPLARLGAERLAEYLQRVTGVAPEIVASDNSAGASAGKPAIVLAKESIPYFRPDGYHITSDAGGNTVRITATAAAGLKNGSHRLIREMRQRGREVCVPPLKLEANPWLKSRELFPADIQWHPTPSEKKILTELREKFEYIYWEPARLDQYVDLIDQYGYNSLMLGPLGGEVDIKVEGMLRRARHNGMGTSFFVMGQSGLKNQDEHHPNCPHDSGQAADIRAHYAQVIDRFGALLDRWMLHWADPGGCRLRGCTVNTPQVMTNEFAEMLHQRGLRSTVSFSLWGLQWRCWEWSWEFSQNVPPWPGYEDWKSVVESGVLSPEIEINLMRRWTFEIAQAIRARNRKVGVWSWYMNDLEINYGMHVHTRILEQEFRRIDPAAAPLLDWFCLEDNNHVLDLPLLYVGAQMLWDTQTSAGQALFDFCDAVWGPEAAPKIHQALLALEEARCGPGEPMVHFNLWPDDYMCNMGRGSRSPAQDVARCEEGLRALEAVKIDSGYVAKFTLPTSPEEWLGHLRAHLQYTRDYARIRVAYHEALQPAVEGGRYEETQRRMASLPELPDIIPGSYGAGSLTFFCGLLRKFAGTWKNRSFSDNLALRKKVTAASWFNQDPRFAPENAVNGILCELTEEGWAADAPGPAWLKIDFGSVQTVRSVRIYNRGYHRDFWDNNLRATPTKAEVFYATEDPDPARGTADAGEPGYQVLGGFDGWAPTDDPGTFQEIKAKEPVRARMIKVVIYAAADNQTVGCGEVEVR